MNSNDAQIRELLLTLFICMNRKNLGYMRRDLCKNIVAQITDDIRYNYKNEKYYSTPTFYKFVIDEIATSILKEASLPTISPHNPTRLLKMTSFESLTFFQKKIRRMKAFGGPDEIKTFFEKKIQKMIDGKNEHAILSRFSDDDIRENKCYSFICERPIINGGHHIEVIGDICTITITRISDLDSHFYINDPNHSCRRVYIRSNCDTIRHDFIWDALKCRWELEIFRPPYSPLSIANSKCIYFYVYLLKKETVNDIMEENITLSSMHHWLCDNKRLVLHCSPGILAVHDENYYLSYKNNKIELISKNRL